MWPSYFVKRFGVLLLAQSSYGALLLRCPEADIDKFNSDQLFSSRLLSNLSNFVEADLRNTYTGFRPIHLFVGQLI